MGNIFNFYRENFHTIIISSILLFTLIVIFSMFEIDFNIQRNINTVAEQKAFIEYLPANFFVPMGPNEKPVNIRNSLFQTFGFTRI